MKRVLLIVICCLLLITGCTHNHNSEVNNYTTETIDTKESDVRVSDIKVIINDKTYTLNLEENETVNEFIELLPQEYSMNELNGNEKYVYLDFSLQINSSNPKRINKGDVMLFGDNCLVIFYESFNTNYSYTKIGHIDNLPDLGNGNITIKLER